MDPVQPDSAGGDALDIPTRDPNTPAGGSNISGNANEGSLGTEGTGGTSEGVFDKREESNVPSERWSLISGALMWLAEHQEKEGFWDVDGYDKHCPGGNRCERFVDNQGTNDVGVTGLTLLAFLGAGYTHESDKKLRDMHMGTVVRKSLRWLGKKQKENGAFDTGDRQMYNHAIAAMAYAEAYGMTQDPLLKETAQDAIDFLEHAQNERGGELLAWRYGARDGENDTSVTGWCVMALKSAELAGLRTSEESMQGALRWVNQTTNKKGLTGYTSKVTSRGEARKRRAMTSVGMLVRMFASNDLQEPELRVLKNGADFVVQHLPEWKEGASFGGGHNAGRMDYYHWYYGSLALFMFAGPDTPFAKLGYWQKWKTPMERAVRQGAQRAPAGHEAGSWDPVSRWAGGGGRIYTTALNTLTLEVYHRYDTALFQ